MIAWARALAMLMVAFAPAVVRAAPGDVMSELAAPGDSGSGLGWDGTNLWVANLQTALGGGANRVTRHDPISGAELGGFNMTFGDVFHGMAFDAEGDIWTDNFNAEDLLLTDIVRVDPSNGDVLTVYPAYGTIYGVALDVPSGSLFQVDNHSVEPGGGSMTGQLYVVDVTDGSLLDGPIETEIVGARGVAWDGETLWIASNVNDSLYRIDIETGETLAQFSAPGEGGVEGLTWDGGCLWYSDTADDTIYRVDHGQADLPECTELAKPPPGGTSDGTDTGTEATGSSGVDDDGEPGSSGVTGGDEPPPPASSGLADTTGSNNPTGSGSDDGPGATGATPQDERPSDGCSCRSEPGRVAPAFALLLLVALRRRSRSRHKQQMVTGPPTGSGTSGTGSEALHVGVES